MVPQGEFFGAVWIYCYPYKFTFKVWKKIVELGCCCAELDSFVWKHLKNLLYFHQASTTQNYFLALDHRNLMLEWKHFLKQAPVTSLIVKMPTNNKRLTILSVGVIFCCAIKLFNLVTWSASIWKTQLWIFVSNCLFPALIICQYFLFFIIFLCKLYLL